MECLFTHPDPEKFIRVAEKVSGQELDWYLMDWGQTTKTIDYAVLGVEYDADEKTIVCEKKETLVGSHDHAVILLKREGEMPIPIDVDVEFDKGEVKKYHIPLLMSRGHKPLADKVGLLEAWAWAKKNYQFKICVKKNSVIKVVLDPLNKSADVDKKNNSI